MRKVNKTLSNAGSATAREMLICFHLAEEQACTLDPGDDTREDPYPKGKLPPADSCYFLPVSVWLSQTWSWGRASAGSRVQPHTE